MELKKTTTKKKQQHLDLSIQSFRRAEINATNNQYLGNSLFCLRTLPADNESNLAWRALCWSKDWNRVRGPLVVHVSDWTVVDTRIFVIG